MHNKETGVSLGDTKYKSPKRAIAHIEEQIAETKAKKSKEKLAKVGRKTKAKTAKEVINNLNVIQKYDEQNKTNNTIEEVTHAIEKKVEFSSDEVSHIDEVLAQHEKDLMEQDIAEYMQTAPEGEAKPTEKEVEAMIEEVITQEGKDAPYNVTKDLTLEMPAYHGKWEKTTVSLSVDSFGQITIDGEMRGTLQDLIDNEDNSKVAEYLSDKHDAYLFDDNQNTVVEDIQSAYEKAKKEGDALS